MGGGVDDNNRPRNYTRNYSLTIRNIDEVERKELPN